MRLFSNVCMEWRSVLTRMLVRANTAAQLAEMYRYPIADESSGVFLLIFVHQNVCQMSGGRKRTQYKEEDGCHYSLAVHNARLHN
jgi:hypothetical protein